MGRASLDLSAVSRGTIDDGFVGGSASLRSHIARDRLAFLSGAIGYGWGRDRTGLEWEVLGGFRWLF